MKKTSTAWTQIAIAYLKRAAEDKLTVKQEDISADGLCNARYEVSGTTHEQRQAMRDIIRENIESDSSYLDVTWNSESEERGMLALIFAADARYNEKRFKTTPGQFVLAGAL